MVGKISNRIVVALLSTWALAACSGGSSGQDAGFLDSGPDAGVDGGLDAGPGDAGFDAGPPLGFAAALQAAAQSPALYSISYGEQSSFLLTVFPVSTSPLACTLDSLQTAADAAWLLELGTPMASGTYPVGPSNSDGNPPTGNQSLVALREHIQSTFTNVTVQPTEGQVVIGIAPTGAAAELGGTHVTGSFHLGFPADPLQPPECFMAGGGGLPDGNFTIDSWCLCKDVAGEVVSVCDGGEPTGGCCVSTAPATVFVDGTFDAPPCYLLCSDPETGQCDALAPDGGGSGGQE